MNCPGCGAVVTAEDKFCPSCGKPLGSPTCPKCNSAVSGRARFCTKCGYDLKGDSGITPQPMAKSAPSQPGIASDLKDLVPGEAVFKDTGFFPITFQKNLFGSTNGKLYLTSRRLVFKAGMLQGIRGVYVAGYSFPIPRMGKRGRNISPSPWRR